MARLNNLIVRQLPDGWLRSPLSPCAASTRSQPEPDLAVIRDSAWEIPSAAALIVEVMETSRRMDLEIKPAIYGASGVAVYAIDIADALPPS